MNKQIFIINGSGGVGKDTFVEMVSCLSNRLVGRGKTSKGHYAAVYTNYLDIENYSSVSKVKEIAKLIGWNGEKTEKDRKFLSDLKLLTTEYNDMPLNDMKNFANRFFNNDSNVEAKILFLHIREPEEITKAVKEFKEYNAKTILVKRSTVKHIISNMADENVYNYDYDITINNNGTLEELKIIAEYFLDDFLNNALKKKY